MEGGNRRAGVEAPEEMNSGDRSLLLLRHAAAEAGRGHPDRDRALTPAGKEAAGAVADWLRDSRTVPELVLCSPARRARQTLDALSRAFGDHTDVQLAEALYRGDAAAVLEQVRKVPDGLARVLVVGHNPSLGGLAQWLATRPDRARLASFPPGAVAHLTTAGAWAAVDEGCMRLAAFRAPETYG